MISIETLREAVIASDPTGIVQKIGGASCDREEFTSGGLNEQTIVLIRMILIAVAVYLHMKRCKREFMTPSIIFAICCPILYIPYCLAAC